MRIRDRKTIKIYVFMACVFLINCTVYAEPKMNAAAVKSLEKSIYEKNYLEAENIFKDISRSPDTHLKTIDDIFILMVNHAVFDYNFVKLYMKYLSDYSYRNSFMTRLLRDGGYFFSKLVDENIITEHDFTFVDKKDDKERMKNRNPICLLGFYGYYDLVREYIYKNKNPYSKCGSGEFSNTELFYAILSRDINAVKYVLESGYLQHIGLNFEKELGRKYFKGTYIEHNIGERPKSKYPLEIALSGNIYDKGSCNDIFKRVPGFDIIKLLIDKGARGISKKKALKLLEETKSQREWEEKGFIIKPKEYEKIKEYIQNNYPDDKPLKKPASN